MNLDDKKSTSVVLRLNIAERYYVFRSPDHRADDEQPTQFLRRSQIRRFLHHHHEFLKVDSDSRHHIGLKMQLR